MPVNLILRLPEMHVAGGADGLAQLPPQSDDGPVEFPQVLLVPGVAAAKHKGVVAKGLDFQVVVEGGDAFQLLPVLMVLYRLEQLSRLAGRPHDHALPVLL